MNNPECSVAHLVLEGIAVHSNRQFIFLGAVVFFLFAMERDGGMFFFIMKYFVDSDAMSSGQNILIPGFGMQLGGVLLKSYWFYWFSFLEVESFAFIVEFFALDKGLPNPSRLIEAYFFRILVKISLYSASRLLPSGPDLDFQIANHLNDHYYILNPTNKPIITITRIHDRHSSITSP